MPTADQVARVIIAAAKQMNVDPIAVVTVYSRLGLSRGGYLTISRARYYAACAMRDAFGCSESACGRILGVKNPDVWMWAMRQSVESAKVGWIDERIATAVLAAAELAASPRPSPPREDIPAFLPARRNTLVTLSDARDSYGEKKRLRDMLTDAVRNTAAMQKEE